MPAPISDTHTIMDKLDRQSASAAIEPLLHYLPRENLQSIVYKVLATNPELIGTICEEYAKFNQWQYNGAILDVLPQCINSLLILERLVAAQTCKSWKEIIHLPISWAGGLHGVYVSNDWIATKAKYFGLFKCVTKLMLSQGNRVDLAYFPCVTEVEIFEDNAGCSMYELPLQISNQLTKLLLNDLICINTQTSYSNLITLSCSWYVSFRFNHSENQSDHSACFPSLKTLIWSDDSDGDSRSISTAQWNKINLFWTTGCFNVSTLVIEHHFLDTEFGVPNLSEMFPMLGELMLDELLLRSLQNPAHLPLSLSKITVDFTSAKILDDEDEDESGTRFDQFISLVKGLLFLQQLAFCTDLQHAARLPRTKVTHWYAESTEDVDDDEEAINLDGLKLKEMVISLPSFIFLLTLHNHTVPDSIEHLILLPFKMEQMPSSDSNRLGTRYTHNLKTSNNRGEDSSDCVKKLLECERQLDEIQKKYNRWNVKKTTCLVEFNTAGEQKAYQEMILRTTQCVQENMFYSANTTALDKYRLY